MYRLSYLCYPTLGRAADERLWQASFRLLHLRKRGGSHGCFTVRRNRVIVSPSCFMRPPRTKHVGKRLAWPRPFATAQDGIRNKRLLHPGPAAAPWERRSGTKDDCA